MVVYITSLTRFTYSYGLTGTVVYVTSLTRFTYSYGSCLLLLHYS